MDYELAATAFVTLFVVIDPIGLSPLFIALTQGMSTAQRRAIAIRAILVSVGILAAFGVGGELVLETIGIGLPAFRISGGILLFLTAIEMLFEKRTKRRENQAEQDDTPDPSVFPLATPLLAGPGAIASMILLMGAETGDISGQLTINLMMLAVLAIAFTLFMSATLLERILGQTGINVITRLLGMLLAALAVQFVLDGVRDLGLFGL